VGHRKWIFLSTVPLFAGDHNDKTIVRDEPFIREVRENKLFTEATRQTYRFDGNLREPMGVHAINDGGYHIRWRETRAGQKPDEAGALAMAVALALSESVRQDSEYVFGIKKKSGVGGVVDRILWSKV